MNERALRVLEFTKIRDMLAAYALSDAGKEKCQQLTPLADFADQVKDSLHIPMVRVVGDETQPVQTVAAMGGAGSDFMADAKDMGADVYVTADLKYHDGQLAAEMGLALIDAGHFETEAATMKPFMEKLANAMPQVEFMLAEKVSSYWKIL